MATETKKKIVWHYVPQSLRRSAEASRHVDSLLTLVGPWLQEKAAGAERPNPRIALHDDVRCALAGALADELEWDGFRLAYNLKTRAWPADAELVQILHRWSCDLKRAAIAAWREKKGLRA